MKKKISNCVDCGLPCLHEACPHYSVTVLICDGCGDEVDELYDVDGEQLCESCLKERFEKVNA